jgi:general L-amino acid transport system permease protein
LWLVLEFAVFNAVFTGENGEACRGEGNQDGACWAMAKARFGQWIYGFYPFAERWRVNIVFLLGALALVPMLIPSLPFKKLNAIFLLGIYPDHHADPADRRQLRYHRFYVGSPPSCSLRPSCCRSCSSASWRRLSRRLAAISSAAIAGIAALLLVIFSIDFGLTYVETSQWGGLLVTLVVAVTGIVASLPMGILLALGGVRRCRWSSCSRSRSSSCGAACR